MIIGPHTGFYIQTRTLTPVMGEQWGSRLLYSFNESCPRSLHGPYFYPYRLPVRVPALLRAADGRKDPPPRLRRRLVRLDDLHALLPVPPPPRLPLRPHPHDPVRTRRADAHPHHGPDPRARRRDHVRHTLRTARGLYLPRPVAHRAAPARLGTPVLRDLQRGPADPGLVRPHGAPPGQRPILPLRREQRRQSDRVARLPADLRTQPGCVQSARDLAGWLWCLHRSRTLLRIAHKGQDLGQALAQGSQATTQAREEIDEGESGTRSPRSDGHADTRER